MSDKILTHPFQEAGLGKAPFKFSHITENLHKVGECVKAGGTCHYCGQGIRYEYWIVSADKKKHPVGCDCVRKTGDSKLISRVENERKIFERNKRREKREKARIDRLQAQRDKNGGLTDYELQEKLRKEKAEKLHEAKSNIIERLKPYADRLEDKKGGFCDNIAQELRNGFLPKGRGMSIMIDILSKQKGRTNSKAYTIEYDCLSLFFDDIQKELDQITKKHR